MGLSWIILTDWLMAVPLQKAGFIGIECHTGADPAHRADFLQRKLIEKRCLVLGLTITLALLSIAIIFALKI